GGPGGRPSLASRERWISGEEAISPGRSIPDGVSLRGDGVWGRRGLLERNRSGVFGNRPDRTALDDLPPREPPGAGEPLLPKRIFPPSLRASTASFERASLCRADQRRLRSDGGAAGPPLGVRAGERAGIPARSGGDSIAPSAGRI